MADWDKIHELKNSYIQSGETQDARNDWEAAIKQEIDEQDKLVEAWNREDIHELRALWRQATELSAYAKQEGMACRSVFPTRALPSEPIPAPLKGVALAMDKQGNWMMNDIAQSIKYA